MQGGLVGEIRSWIPCGAHPPPPKKEPQKVIFYKGPRYLTEWEEINTVSSWKQTGRRKYHLWLVSETIIPSEAYYHGLGANGPLIRLFSSPDMSDYGGRLEVRREVTQSCAAPCNPIDCSPPGSSVHGIFQARVLEWVATSFSRGTSRPGDRTQVSHMAGRRFTHWATREAQRPISSSFKFSGKKPPRVVWIRVLPTEQSTVAGDTVHHVPKVLLLHTCG